MMWPISYLHERLLADHPHWTNEEALAMAELLSAIAEPMSFQLAVERDLAALPVQGEAA